MYYIGVRLSSLVTWHLSDVVDKFVGQVGADIMNRNNLQLLFSVI